MYVLTTPTLRFALATVLYWYCIAYCIAYCMSAYAQSSYTAYRYGVHRPDRRSYCYNCVHYGGAGIGRNYLYLWQWIEDTPVLPATVVPATELPLVSRLR